MAQAPLTLNLHELANPEGRGEEKTNEFIRRMDLLYRFIRNDIQEIATLTGGENEGPSNGVFVRRDGTLALTANWNAGAYNIVSGATIQAEHLYSTDDIVADGDITATGTVQGEHIYSTDDIVADGNITAAGTVQGEHLYSTDDLQVDDDAEIDGRVLIGGGIPADTGGVIYVGGDYDGSNSVWIMNSDGSVTPFANTGGIVKKVVVDSNDDIFVCGDRVGGFTVWKYLSTGALDTSWGTNGAFDTGEADGTAGSTGLVIGGDGTIFVSAMTVDAAATDEVFRIAADGQSSISNTGLIDLTDITVTTSYVFCSGDRASGNVVRYDKADLGNKTKYTVGNGLNNTLGISSNGSARIYVTGTRNSSKSIWWMSVVGATQASYDTGAGTRKVLWVSGVGVIVTGERTAAVGSEWRSVWLFDESLNYVASYDTGGNTWDVSYDSVNSKIYIGGEVASGQGVWKFDSSLNVDEDFNAASPTIGGTVRDVAFAATGSVAVANDLNMIGTTTNLSRSFVSDSADNLLVEGDVEVQGTSYLATVDIDAGTIDDVAISGGTIDGATIATSDITVGAGKTLDVSAGTLTTSAAQKEFIMENAAADIDIGAYDMRAQTLTADGLTSGRVVFAGASGLLSDDADFTFSVDTLTVTKIGAFEAAGAINFADQNMTNVDIDSGAIDGTVIGANAASTAEFISVEIPATSDATTGVFFQNSSRFIHSFGTGNLFVGLNAGNFTLSGASNLGIGFGSGNGLTTGYQNAFIGYQAGASYTTGLSNIAIGYQAAQNSTTPRFTTAIGPQALQNNEVDNSVGIGLEAGKANISGSEMVAIGAIAMRYSTDADRCTAVGYSALGLLNGTGGGADDNTVVGAWSMRKATTATDNTMVGSFTGFDLTTGDRNTCFGKSSGANLIAASDNTLLGYITGLALTSGSSNVLIGASAGSQLTTESNLLYIANTNTTTPLIYGEFDNAILRVYGQEIVRSTSTQLELEYDASNQVTFKVGATGNITVVPSGGDFNVTGYINASVNVTGVDGIFSDDVIVGDTLDVADNAIIDGRLVVSGAGLELVPEIATGWTVAGGWLENDPELNWLDEGTNDTTNPTTINLSNGAVYKVVFTVTNYSSIDGSIYEAYLGGTLVQDVVANGTYTNIVTCGATEDLTFVSTSGGGVQDTWTIENISVVPYESKIKTRLTFENEGSGLQFAQIYEEDGTGTRALAAQDTQYQVVSFSANGESNGAVPDHTNDHITVAKAGKYLALISISFSQTTAVSIEYDFHVKINNGATDIPCISAHRNSGGASAVGSASASGIVDLAANDTVELWVERLDGGAVSRTITFQALQLNLVQIGGT